MMRIMRDQVAHERHHVWLEVRHSPVRIGQSLFEQLLRQALLEGTDRLNPHTYWGILKCFLWYRTSMVEGTHPMVTGFVRLKDRLNRRPGLPIEGRLQFFRRRVREVRHMVWEYAKILFVGFLAIVVVGCMGLLAGMNAAVPAAARVSGAEVVPAGSGGAQQWVSFYSGPGAQEDDAAAIAVARNGSAVFVTGWSTSADRVDRDYATVAYKASTGAKLWTEMPPCDRGCRMSQSSSAPPTPPRIMTVGPRLGPCGN
jgi:hypothetical protein